MVVLVLLMDIRHPLTALDLQMIRWASESNLPTQVLLTKADKFKRGKIASTVLKVEKELEKHKGDFGVEPFSSLNFTGVNAMRSQIQEWIDDSVNTAG